ncbi:MAG: rod shape-determining protein MreC [Thermomicrobiales bacterium]|nr:rod shape-determining protein MreC [Thermomicrobiales bacterium]
MFSLSATARRNLAVIAAVVVAALLLMFADTRGLLDAPKRLADNVVSPVSSALTSLGMGIGKDNPGGDPTLRQQLDEVTAERDALLAENAKLKELSSEVENLRQQLNFQESRPDLTYVTAEVISRDPESREKFVIINRGSNDGLQIGMAVVSPNFLVGQITEVEANRAKVLLIIDSGFQTGGRLQMARAEGIVYGLWQEGGRVEMRHIPYDVNIDDREVVVTSGKSAGIPEGLVVGKVMEIKKNQAQNETVVEILPLVNFENLESVTVITGTTPAQPQEQATPGT